MARGGNKGGTKNTGVKLTKSSSTPPSRTNAAPSCGTPKFGGSVFG